MSKQEKVYCTAGNHLIDSENWRSLHNMCAACYDDVSGVAEYRERRILFIHAMRQPEMRLLLHALQAVHIEYDIDWRAIQSAEIDIWGEYQDCWMLRTDKWQVYTLWTTKPGLSRYDFSLDWYHVEGDPACKCEDCREARNRWEDDREPIEPGDYRYYSGEVVYE
jgi:hypothetical protein